MRRRSQYTLLRVVCLGHMIRPDEKSRLTTELYKLLYTDPSLMNDILIAIEYADRAGEVVIQDETTLATFWRSRTINAES